jgi:phage gp45-like
MLKFGTLKSSDDTGDLRKGTAAWLGRDGQKIQLASLYGLMHNPPDGSQVLILPQNGQESNSIGLPDHPKLRPLKDLKKGEVALANYLTDSYSLHKENGDIEVVTTGAANITLNGVIIDSSGNITLPPGAGIITSGGTTNINGVAFDASGNTVTAGTMTADNFIET